MATLPMVIVEVEEKAPVECPIALNRITNVHLDLQWLWWYRTHWVAVFWSWLFEATIRNLIE